MGPAELASLALPVIDFSSWGWAQLPHLSSVSAANDHTLSDTSQAKECQERPVKCRFCELTMHVSTLETHEAHCGFRTERCPHCDQLILLWVLDQHRDVCQLKQALSREGEQLGKGKL